MACLTRPEINYIRDKVDGLQSKRAQIMESLRLTLETIKKKRGYDNDLCEASYDVKGWDAKSEDQTPLLYLIDDTTSVVRHAGCIREYTWNIRLYGVYRQGDMLAFEEFISDVEQCIYDNNTLNSLVNKCEVISITTDNQLFSAQTDTHLCEIVCAIEYTRKARNAR